MTTRTCEHCGNPFTPCRIYQKYCHSCAEIVHKERAREWYQRHKAHVQELKQSYKEDRGLCACCHERPKAPGNHYLCSLCFEWDGDSWREYYSQNEMDHKRAMQSACKLAEEVGI